MGSALHNILFVIEGDKEESVVKNLQKVFFGEKTIITCVFGTVVYALYKEISADTDLDVFPLLQKRLKELEGFTRDSFSEVYLFFDYDKHASNASDTKLEALLNTFDNETENGKLYVSYPMLEALKHCNNLACFKDLIAKCSPDYKKQVNREGASKYIDFNTYDKKVWSELTEAHLCKMNYIVTDNYSFPTDYFLQSLIFEKQKVKYGAKDDKTVAVLSAFPIFIYDYFGSITLEEKLK